MAGALPSAGPDPIDVTIDVLTEQGPMTEEQLLAALVKRGVDLGEEPDEELRDALDFAEVPVTVLADNRWVWLPALLAGRIFTHRLTDSEVAHDFVRASPDLAAIDWLFDHEEYRRLADGSEVSLLLLGVDDEVADERGIPLDEIGDDVALLLPPGYFAERGVGPGDLVALRLRGDELTLEAVEEPAPSTEEVDALRELFGAVFDAEPVTPVELHTVLWSACADSPAAFGRPARPLAETLDACGVVLDGEHVAPAGFDFDRWRTGLAFADLARRYDLDNDAAIAVLGLVMLYDNVAEAFGLAVEAQRDAGDAGLDAQLDDVADESAQPDAASRGAVAELLPLLAEPAVARAVLNETVELGGGSAAVLGAFAEMLMEQAPAEARPALFWLQGHAHERLGDADTAEAVYQRAEELDPEWEPVLFELARFASDRGDAARGLELLRRAGLPRDHDLVVLLERFAGKPRRGMSLNQPCWCGSGQKYKKCHLGKEQLPLDDRVLWLYRKAASFAETFRRGEVLEVAQERAAHWESDDALLRGLLDPLVVDAVLFEGGAFEEFLAVRGELLPDDERLLAEQWLLIDRSVYDVSQVRAGAGLSLRDVRTGDVYEVRERTASRELRAGDLICARVVPAGDSMQIFGGIEPVVLHERDQAIALLDSEPDAVELVSFLSRRFAPPVLTNTEGEPMVSCEATLQTGKPAELAAKLDELYERTSDRPRTWHEFVVTDEMKTIRARLQLTRGKLTIEANSEERFERVLANVGQLDPKLSLLVQSRIPANQLAARRGYDLPPAEKPTDPAVVAALGEMIREYERKWLDDSIPALSGLTPRQAAADPTRRGDLIKLLDSFPHDPDNPGMMNVDRLRAALDLD